VTIFTCFFSPSNAQYFSTGQDPACIKWRQINTEHFQLIFPSEYEAKGQYLANVFEALYDKVGASLNHRSRKFSILLHSRGATSNGLVAWAPKKMELYTTPPQTSFPQKWLDQLAIHEFRHVIQMDKVQQGFTRFLNVLFGEQATAAVVGLYIPPWFMEGDAVCAETGMSNSGRGRLPFFEQELRAQLLEKGSYSYDKAALGSYRDFVTNRYKLGYYLVAMGRKNYGPQLWEGMLNQVGRNPLGITPFSRGIKKGIQANRSTVLHKRKERFGVVAGQDEKTPLDGKKILYQDNITELALLWKQQDDSIRPSTFEKLSPDPKVYTGYRFPHFGENDIVICQKEGLADAGQFITLDGDGKEERLFMPGYDFGSSFDYRNGLMIWAENFDHLRWEHGDKAKLVIYDTRRQKHQVIKFSSNLFAPVFSSDGGQIMAVETTREGACNIVILDSQTHQLIKRLDGKVGQTLLTPQWDGKDHYIAFVLDGKGKRMVRGEIATGHSEEIVSLGYSEIAQPRVTSKYIFYTAAYNGIDNIYAYERKDGKIFRVTSSRFGARDAHISSDGNRMLYADYSSEGYRIAKIDLQPEKWEEWDQQVRPFELAESLSSQEGWVLNPDSLPEKKYESKRYSRIAHLFNFHSWAPAFVDGLEQETDIGVSVATQNKLNTLLATVGYRREQGFDKGQYYVNFSYRRWFPIIDSKFTYGDRDITFFTRAERVDNGELDTIQVQRSWSQWEWENSISFPFNFSRGKYSRRMIPKITYNQQHLINFETVPIALYTRDPNKSPGTYRLENKDISQDILEYQLFGYNILKSAPRDLQPRWGQILEFNYRHTPWGDTDLGESWSGEARLYFPGLVKHHGMKLYGGYQKRDPFDSRFANTINSPRGMQDLWGEEIATVGIDYKFPICYPDWNLGPLAYFKRIKASLFYDRGYEKGQYAGMDETLISFEQYSNSFGVELNADVHFLRFPAPVDLGIRLGYEDRAEDVFAKLLLRIDLSSY
jgi:hypothetical protein